MRIECLALGPLQTNCYVLSNDAGDMVLIDPGGDDPELLDVLADQQRTLRAVLLTHAHFDHIGGLTAVMKHAAVPVILDPEDEWLYDSPKNCLPPYQAPEGPLPPTVRHWDDPAPGFDYATLATPGHTPGGRSYHFAAYGVVFSGDVLFSLSIGRTDLPGGDSPVLARSIRQVLYQLPDETTVCPGHGPTTQIGREKAANLFIRPEAS